MQLDELDQAERDRFETDREERLTWDRDYLALFTSDDATDPEDAYKSAPAWYWL